MWINHRSWHVICDLFQVLPHSRQLLLQLTASERRLQRHELEAIQPILPSFLHFPLRMHDGKLYLLHNDRWFLELPRLRRR